MNTSTENSHADSGSASIVFMGRYIAITNLYYCLLTADGKRFEGKTNGEGAGGTIVLGEGVSVDLPEPVWQIGDEAPKVLIQIEVRRDDGTWKNIGSFQLETGRHKLVTAQIDTIKMPFQLGLVNNNTQA